MDIIAKAERIVKSKFGLLIGLIIAVTALWGYVIKQNNDIANIRVMYDMKEDAANKRCDSIVGSFQKQLYECQQDSKIEKQNTILAERERNKKLTELWLTVERLKSGVASESTK